MKKLVNSPVFQRVLKVSGYIILSVLITVLTSKALSEYLEVNIDDQYLYAVVNIALAALGKSLKESFPEVKGFQEL